jgi:SAM-dependent methyltransferase
MNTRPKSTETLFKEAEQLFNQGKIEKATEKYLKLTDDNLYAPFSYFRLADISNRTEDPLKAKELYYTALKMKPDIYKGLLPEGHPNRDYLFLGKKDEILYDKCPLCGEFSEAHWCYATLGVGAAYFQKYNPVRVWLLCQQCNHLFAEEYPEKSPESEHTAMKTNPHFFPYYSDVLARIMQYITGNDLLEVGIGGSECAIVAREMGFDVFGIDIAAANVKQAKKYGIAAEAHDFSEFEPDRKWDVIILGDVIEHVPNPAQSLAKAYCLLNDNGVLWISTPNFESCFSSFAGHDDPMRMEATHKNYFSRFSLFNLLDRFEFMPVDYRVSSHYNGSMEVIVVKKSYCK